MKSILKIFLLISMVVLFMGCAEDPIGDGGSTGGGGSGGDGGSTGGGGSAVQY